MTSAGDIFKEHSLPERDVLLIDKYVKYGRPVDQLAYSDEFDKLYSDLQTNGDKRTKQQVFRRLLNLRKAGWLPRLGAA